MPKHIFIEENHGLIYKENDNGNSGNKNNSSGNFYDSIQNRSANEGWFDRNSFRFTVAQGVEEGYLSPLVGASNRIQMT